MMIKKSLLEKVSLFTSTVFLLSACGSKVNFQQSGSTGESNGGPSNNGGLGNHQPPPGDSQKPYLDESLSVPDPGTRSVDILFIDDNSGSMTPDQANIAPKFQNFINQLQGVDWQIGITTTDVTWDGLNGSLSQLRDANGNLTNSHILRPGPRAQEFFENTIQRPEVGDGNERAIIASQRAIQKRNDPSNVGFFRNGVPLAIVILSDEDENSDSYGRSVNNPVPSGYETWSSEDEPLALFKTFSSTFPGKSLSINSIQVVPGDSACLAEQRAQVGAENTAYYANVYAALVQQTGGVTGSICDTSFTGPLSKIGGNISAQLSSVSLKEIPDATSLILTVTPEDPSAHWTLSGNKIFFDKALAKGTVVKAHYKKQGTDFNNNDSASKQNVHGQSAGGQNVQAQSLEAAELIPVMAVPRSGHTL